MARNRSGDRKRAANASEPSVVVGMMPTQLIESSRPLPPPPRVAAVVTTAIMLHAALIGLAYLAVVRPSGIQGRVIAGFAPYLATLYLAPEPNAVDAATAEGVSFFLARGERNEQVHRLQTKPSTDRSEAGWVDAPFLGAAGSSRQRRQQRFLTTIANLGQNDQNALAGRLTLPLIAADPDARMVRVIRLPNIMTNIVRDAEPAPYTAAILREQDAVRLVRVPAPRLGAAATGNQEPQP